MSWSCAAQFVSGFTVHVEHDRFQIHVPGGAKTHTLQTQIGYKFWSEDTGLPDTYNARSGWVTYKFLTPHSVAPREVGKGRDINF